MRALPALLLVLAVVACSREPAAEPPPAATPLPTKQTTIDRAQQGLDAAAAESARQRAEIERAAR
jgi:hypothetical protein